MIKRKKNNITGGALSFGIRGSVLWIALAGFLCGTGSCIKEEFNPDLLDPSLQINPGVATPIGWAYYRVDEILADSNYTVDSLVIGSDGFMSLIYRQDIYSLNASELINIPDLVDQTIDINSPFPVPFDLRGIATDTTFPEIIIKIPLPLVGAQGSQIDSIVLKTGMLEVTMESDYPGMEWDCWMNLLDTDSTVIWNVKLDPDFPGPESGSIDGRTLPIDPVTNSLIIRVTLALGNSDVVINPGRILSINVGLSNLEYSVIYGYLGRFDIDIGPQSFPINFFSRLAGETFHFHDPRFTIGFRNSFGLPIQISMDNFVATGRDGGFYFITGDSVPGSANPRVLAFPRYGQEGERIEDSIVLTNSNSEGFFEALEASPREISVEVNGTTNPAGYDSNNFILDTSSLDVSTELVLPLDGYADVLYISDTIRFVFSEFYENPPEEIKRLIFRLDYHSQIPTYVYTQVYFLDDQDPPQRLDSLFHDEDDPRRFVRGAEVDPLTGIARPFNDRIDVELTREQIDNISGSQYINMWGEISTTGYDPTIVDPMQQEHVRFYSYYFFNTWIGAIAELELNSDDY